MKQANSSKSKKNKADRGYYPKIVLISIIIILAVGFFRSINENKKAGNTNTTPLVETRQTRFHMDTYIEIVIAAPAKDKDLVEKAIKEGFKVFEELEKKYNYFDSGSLLENINEEASSSIEDEETLSLIRKSLEFSDLTGRAFDPTMGAFKKLYPIGEKETVPPTDEEITEALKISGRDKVKLEGNRLSKPDGLLLDLGGILKGYAVDRAWKKISDLGIKNFMVNGGGNIHSMGRNTKSKIWRIGIENPRKTEGGKSDIIGVISLDNEAVATSGDYQRYFIYQGKRYHHLIDPETGHPGDKAIAATVIAPDAMTADVMSTTSFIMGRDKGIKFLEDHNLEGIIIDEKGWSVTKGFEKKASLKLTPQK